MSRSGVEKEALIDVAARAADRFRVGHFACRGFVSQSEMWQAAQRFNDRLLADDGCEHIVILHLGDHDPSGIDMTRDINDRLSMFLEGEAWTVGLRLSVKRIALNMEQIEQYEPPPNPAKSTDSRYTGYAEKYGDESWELDALDPKTLDDLITKEIKAHCDYDLFNSQAKAERETRELLKELGRHPHEVLEFAKKLRGE